MSDAINLRAKLWRFGYRAPRIRDPKEYDSRHYRKVKKARHPRTPGRPITSTHPRAEYWREYKRRKYQEARRP